MSNLNVTYLGLKLKSPIVISSMPMTADIEMLKALEAAGAGAVVLPSLFQEQLVLEDMGFLSSTHESRDLWPEHLKRLPDLRSYNTGFAGYLNLLYHASRAVDIPLIASLNATSASGIERYARLLSSAGAAAIELNIYNVPTELFLSAEKIEAGYLELVRAVCASVKIPVTVKMHPYFSSLPYMASQLVEAGAAGLTLFNRFYHPDINIETEAVEPSLVLSNSDVLRKRLRWIAILYGRLDADLSVTGGVHTGADAVKAILSGATVVSIASAVLRNGPGVVTTILDDLSDWMDAHNYPELKKMRGKLSPRRSKTTAAFERANYINELYSYKEKVPVA